MFLSFGMWDLPLAPIFLSLPRKHKNKTITFVQRRPNVFDVGPALCKRYINVLCLLGTDLPLGPWTFLPLLTEMLVFRRQSSPYIVECIGDSMIRASISLFVN